jgi:hypothetical protein
LYENQDSQKVELIDQVVALYDFQSTTQETLGFHKDAIINILEKNGDWWLGELNGQRGLLPYNYVQSTKKGNYDFKPMLRDDFSSNSVENYS